MRGICRNTGTGLTLLILLLAVFSTGCGALFSLLQNPDYIYEEGAVLVGGDEQPIRLENNPEAVNTTYAGVLEFIRRDGTDRMIYIGREADSGLTPFVCSDFAELVHNNAEAEGIRAAYLSIDFADGGIGHAINAFETTDRGMVYIDCTGQSIYSELEDTGNAFLVESWDKVAYIEIGQKYGAIPLELAESPEYSFYLEYDRKWQEYKRQLSDYNIEVKRFNQEISGKVFRRGSAEFARITAWEEELREKENALEALRQELGGSRFKSLGVVKSIRIHW